jgi:hypothetical protein
MLFMVWSDTGSQLRAYCVPDTFSGTCRPKIFRDGKLTGELEPNDFNEHMAGRHATGQVGFIIDENTIRVCRTRPIWS